MDLACHRCGATIATPELFCPHCGAPQLRFEPAEEQLPYQANGNSTGPHANQPVAWRHAVQAALVVALPLGLLSSLLDFFDIIWVLAGGFYFSEKVAATVFRQMSAGKAAARTVLLMVHGVGK